MRARQTVCDFSMKTVMQGKVGTKGGLGGKGGECGQEREQVGSVLPAPRCPQT